MIHLDKTYRHQATVTFHLSVWCYSALRGIRGTSQALADCICQDEDRGQVDRERRPLSPPPAQSKEEAVAPVGAGNGP